MTPPIIIDVRSTSEFASGHVRGSINVPLDRFSEEIEKLVSDKNTPLLLCCLSGGRSGMACNFLQQRGYQQVRNGGSTQAVALQTGLPLERL
jgi:phage shock protein E